MDRFEKICIGGICVCLIALGVLGVVAYHDIPMVNEAQIDMELSFYLQVNDNMTKLERYDLALLISEEAYYELSNDLWLPILKDEWIKKSIFKLVKLTNSPCAVLYES